MAKIECPKNLIPFHNLVSRLYNRHSAHQVFSDFLEIIICCYAFQQMEERYFKIIARYKKEELTVIAEMFAKIVVLYDDTIRSGRSLNWEDWLGTYYEIVLQTNSKASGFGQFFTPKIVCDMSAKMLLTQEHAGKNLKINDNCCGSGRMILAANAVAPGNLFFAEDLDPMCVNLTAVNFLFHGVDGQIVCRNSLNPLSWEFGYEIYKIPMMEKSMPVIREIEKEQSFVYLMDKDFRERATQKTETETIIVPKTTSYTIPKKPVTEKTKELHQLSLF